jgi:anthranilate synthase component II
MILLIDNYDSFVHNLARYFQVLGQETMVVRNDVVDRALLERVAPSAVVISPGPCSPSEAGSSLDIVRALPENMPLLGVCLGHQVIAAAFGASIIRAPQPVHGRASEIVHTGRGLFAGLPSPLRVGRYHSLIVDRATLPEELEVIAETVDGIVMAIVHRSRPIVGVQFHPEAILTEAGLDLLANFIRNIGEGAA